MAIAAAAGVAVNFARYSCKRRGHAGITAASIGASFAFDAGHSLFLLDHAMRPLTCGDILNLCPKGLTKQISGIRRRCNGGY